MKKSMLKVGLIGCGNAGSQVVDLAVGTAEFEGYIINSSARDISNCSNIDGYHIALIGQDGFGAGKDRNRTKQYIKTGIKEYVLNEQPFRNFMKDKQVIVIIASTGGGTGSALAPVLIQMLPKLYPSIKFILAQILPTLEESIDTLENTMQFMKDLPENYTIMSYDNNKQGNVNGVEGRRYINEQIVQDLKVIRGDYINNATADGIDERDLLTILNAPGRLAVDRLLDISQTSTNINEMLVKNITDSDYTTSLDNTKGVEYIAVMQTLSSKLESEFNSSISELRSLVGEGKIYSNISKAESGDKNSVCVIMNGLALPYSQFDRIASKLTEIKESRTKDLENKSNKVGAWDSYESTTQDTIEDTKEFDLDAFLSML